MPKKAPPTVVFRGARQGVKMPDLKGRDPLSMPFVVSEGSGRRQTKRAASPAGGGPWGTRKTGGQKLPVRLMP
jgi:hypothetical protein